MHQRGEVEIQDISNSEDKPLSWVKLSSQDLYQAEMLKQYREFSMFVRCTIETHEKAGIRPSKIYQSFVAAAGNHLN
ncbi:Transposon protein [Arachis hypogaea]|nr:Transposon protein [Arachis hypogaea]